MKARSATLAKGLEVLSFVAFSSRPPSLQEVAAGLGLTRPTAHRLLATLVDYGLLRFDSSEACYRLGMRLFELSRQIWRDIDLRGAALAEMRKLHSETGETISLAVLTPDGAVYVDELQSSHHLREQSRVGHQVAKWQSAMGKALISGLAHEDRTRMVERDSAAILQRGLFSDLAALNRHLDLINARGYAIEVDDDVPGVAGVAAPILDHRGVTVAAIGLSGASQRLERDELHRLGAGVIEATRQASLNAGGSPRPVSTARPPDGFAVPAYRTVARVENLIGECPVLNQDRSVLLWVDICRPCIFRCDLATGETDKIPQDEMACSIAVTDDGILVAGQSGIRIVDLDSRRVIRELGNPEAHVPTNRFNDGKLDSRGRFWVGTLAFTPKAGEGGLYRIDTDGQSHHMDEGLTLPNGLGWSPDDTRMYLVESAERCVYEYDFDPGQGTITNRRKLIQFPRNSGGTPDGLAVNPDGSLWIAMWDGWGIVRYSPEGELLERRMTPFPRPTSIAAVNGEQPCLFVTSARIRVSRELLRDYPESGNLIRIPVGG